MKSAHELAGLIKTVFFPSFTRNVYLVNINEKLRLKSDLLETSDQESFVETEDSLDLKVSSHCR